MRKRLRKKVGKYKCLVCGSEDGMRGYHRIRGGRYVPTELLCAYCVLGMPRD